MSADVRAPAPTTFYREIDRNDQDILAIYHSSRTGLPVRLPFLVPAEK